jgi:guanylate kinase
MAITLVATHFILYSYFMESDKNFAQKIAGYKPSAKGLAHVQDVPLLLAVGITAAGKDTVLHRLIEKYPDDYRYTVSHTTRKPRENNGVLEQEGDKYYFVDMPTAMQMLDEEAFLEVNYYASNLYGTSIREIERGGQDGKILVNDIDVNGIANFVRLGMNAKPVFLLPPGFEVWQKRQHARYAGEFDAEDMRKRLQTALAELQDAIKHDYYYLVVNDDLDKTVELVNDIAHGKQIEARYPKAVELARQLTADIAAELTKLA